MQSLWTKGLLSFALLTCVAVAPAGATLIDRGAFNDGFSGTVNLIYDTDLDITWLGDANFSQTSGFDGDGKMDWTTATTVWAPSLVVGGFTDWRLPTTTQPDTSCGFQIPFGGFPDQGLGTGCTGSEMGHLFNVEGITAAAPGVFDNVQANFYWSGTEFAPLTGNAWVSSFNIPFQIIVTKSSSVFGWAVRSGDVSAPPVIPEPSTMVLLGSGLVGLIGWRRARRGVVI